MGIEAAGYQHVGGQILSQEQFIGGATNSGQHQYAGVPVGPVAGTPTVPTFSTAPVVTGSPQVGTPLAFMAGQASGNPQPNVTFRWRLNGNPVGSDNAAYVPQTGDIGAIPTVRQTAVNSQGSVTSDSANGPAITAASGPAPSPNDARPRYGVGPAAFDGTSLDTLFATMTATGNNGDKAMASFNVNPTDGTHFGWVAIEAAASAQGVTFRNPGLETGGWQGAGSAGNNGADDGSSPNTSTVLRTISGVSFRFFRQSYGGAPGDFTTV